MSTENERYELQRIEYQRQIEREQLAREEFRRAAHADLFKKEFGNRCANNDAPAVMGGLCAGCYAAERAAEKPDRVVRRPGEDLRDFVERLPEQNHHLSTNKGESENSLARRAECESILQRYGLSLDHEENMVSVHHRGRHPDAYHDFVLGTIQFIDEEARGNRERFLSLYDELVRQTVVESPEMLRRAGWWE